MPKGVGPFFVSSAYLLSLQGLRTAEIGDKNKDKNKKSLIYHTNNARQPRHNF